MDGARDDILAFAAFPKEVRRQAWSNNPQERLNPRGVGCAAASSLGTLHASGGKDEHHKGLGRSNDGTTTTPVPTTSRPPWQRNCRPHPEKPASGEQLAPLVS
jgi:Transposase, Mutator family